VQKLEVRTQNITVAELESRVHSFLVWGVACHFRGLTANHTRFEISHDSDVYHWYCIGFWLVQNDTKTDINRYGKKNYFSL